jgi:hypothetical protein
VARENLGVECRFVRRQTGCEERSACAEDLHAERIGHCSLSFSDWKKVTA